MELAVFTRVLQIGWLESVEEALVPVEGLELEAHGLVRAFLIVRRRHERCGSCALRNALFPSANNRPREYKALANRAHLSTHLDVHV